MADSIGDVGRLEDAVTPEGGHQTGTRRLVVGVPDAVSDRIFDRRKVTAPQPVVVGQAGIERLNSRSARAVALDAMDAKGGCRSEEHTSELQSLMRISYAVFCLKKKKT